MINRFKVRFELKDNGNNTQNLYGISYQNSVQISEINFGNIVDILNYKQKNTNYKQALIDIRNYCKLDKQNQGHICYVGGKYEGIKIVCDDILQIIDKALGGSNEIKS